MNIEVNDILAKISGFLPKIIRFMPFIFAVALISVYVFFGLQISRLAEAKLSPEAIKAKEADLEETTIDEDAVNAMRLLRERSITVKSDIKPGDDPSLSNPFEE